ncbi:LOW QUALITY PROTEIN: apoptotic chromatin condensation inducer in the nucleus [Drosophila nasuta]|uniref:LOW QUALITY PROTEIN: apoptotic chromatin condensation inducer in the nucleus n=1 Tax=Drosophila nasuta TaxID=42062 RepID=UPI00295E6FF2|nr:LOW QUALITY PROTEIN: apoptotic chromatin condensation inducer in the nucleus [Drosophila nasuta]
MRRRSERKKSSSPAPLPVQRRSRRSRKVSENEKTEDETTVVVEKVDKEKVEDTKAPPIIEEINEERASCGEGERASSEEKHAAPSQSPSPVRKSRSTRTTPKKRNQRDKSVEHNNKVETIPEEIENGAETVEKSVDIDNNLSNSKKPEEIAAVEESTEAEPKPQPEKSESELPVKSKVQEEEETAKEQHEDDTTGTGTGKVKGKGSHDDDDERSMEEVKVASSLSFTANKDEEQLKTTSDVLDIQTEDVEVRNLEKPKSDSASKLSLQTDEQKENQAEQSASPATVTSTEQHPDKGAANKEDEPGNNTSLQRSVRKRKWLSKKIVERTQPVLAISTDSLKNIIADVVNPVPLSDVQLESSSEEEGLVTSDHDETDEHSLTPELTRVAAKERDEGNETDEEQRPKLQSKQQHDKETPASQTLNNKSVVENAPNASVNTAAAGTAPAAVVARSPSPARNRASHVLYISNLVRPFTVLQLKGLLARTGKIVDDDGFWIDRIKSKCYVAYATEDEAIETRHALHGVRWPVSNPKCLNVDFGSRTDMDRAIQSTKNETPKYPQDNTRDNQNAGNTWSRLDASDKKPARPVREWDVGKKEPNDRDKSSNDRRRSSKERVDSRLRDSERGKGGADEAERSGQDRKRSRERDRGGRDRERSDHHGHGRSRSGSPGNRRKKENEPPIRLLDDLFRKTKGTPCIYWLPLTPEAIAEKEAFRQKRIEEHKQRIKEREERVNKEREREKDRDRQRDNRRSNRSNDRRRSSRSRDRDRERRRY